MITGYAQVHSIAADIADDPGAAAERVELELRKRTSVRSRRIRCCRLRALRGPAQAALNAWRSDHTDSNAACKAGCGTARGDCLSSATRFVRTGDDADAARAINVRARHPWSHLGHPPSAVTQTGYLAEMIKRGSAFRA